MTVHIEDARHFADFLAGIRQSEEDLALAELFDGVAEAEFDVGDYVTAEEADAEVRRRIAEHQ